MKYRVKEIITINGRRYIPQKRVLGLFWKSYTEIIYPEFWMEPIKIDIVRTSLLEALEYITKREIDDAMNKAITRKKITHKYEDINDVQQAIDFEQTLKAQEEKTDEMIKGVGKLAENLSFKCPKVNKKVGVDYLKKIDSQLNSIDKENKKLKKESE